MLGCGISGIIGLHDAVPTWNFAAHPEHAVSAPERDEKKQGYQPAPSDPRCENQFLQEKSNAKNHSSERGKMDMLFKTGRGST